MRALIKKCDNFDTGFIIGYWKLEKIAQYYARQHQVDLQASRAWYKMQGCAIYRDTVFIEELAPQMYMGGLTRR